MASKLKQLSINVSDETVEVLKRLAEERGSSMSELVRHAIGLENYFDKVVKEEGKVLVERKGGQLREVLLQR